MFRIVRDVDLWNLIEDSKARKIILYAEDKYINELLSIFRNIDVKIDYIIGEAYGTSLFDLMYEDFNQIMVVVAKDDFNKEKYILENMGLRIGVNFKNLKKYSKESLSTPYYYDPVCGYNLYTGGNYNGFKVFGNIESDNALRILTMGGSTTDAFLYPFKSWSEFLYELLESNGIESIVFCGAVSGYSSADELYKIIRDGLQLQPDIIINYSGCNDIKLGDNPYINSYMRRICDYLEMQNGKIGTRFESNPFGVTWGINMKMGDDDGDSNYSFWIKNQRMIHAISECFNIKHVTLHQPNMCNGKKTLTEYERSYLVNCCYCGVLKQSIEENIHQSVQFSEKAAEDSKKYPWLVDASDLFGEEDVYIDRLHVNEEGNRIVAQKVYSVIKENDL